MKDKMLIALGVLVLVLSGFLVYESAFSGMSKAEVKTEFEDLKQNYEFLQRDLEQNIVGLQINNKTILAQKQKIETLLKKSDITEAELEVAKKIMKSISQSVLDEFNHKVKGLQVEKQKLTDESTETQNLLLDLNKKITVLESQYKTEKKESEKKTVLLNYASSLSLSNFDLKGVKVRNSGKEVETDKASRIDKIKVNFDINDNPLANSGKKELYISVYKPDGQLASFENGNGGIFAGNGLKQPYSDKIIVDYTKGNKNTVEFDWSHFEFSKGDYKIEVYEKTPNRFAKIGGSVKKLE